MKRSGKIKLYLYGNPCVTDNNDKIIYIKNRKELAVYACVARSEDKRLSRNYLASRLWSNVDRNKAQASLRQALKNIRAREKKLGVAVLSTPARDVVLAADSIWVDVDEVSGALARATKNSVAKASRLYSPTFMDGFQDVDREFDAWRKSEEHRLKGALVERAILEISKISDVTDPCLGALARFVLKVDPLSDWARQRLEEYDRASRADEKSTAGRAETKQGAVSTPGRLPDFGRGRQGEASPPPVIDKGIFPIVFTESSELRTGAPVIYPELVDRISRNREFVLRDTVKGAGSSGSTPPFVGIDEVSGGQFVLTAVNNSRRGNTLIELRERGRGEMVFADSLSLSPGMQADERAVVLDRFVIEMQERVRAYYLRSPTMVDMVYRRLSKVYDLIREFDVGANTKALKILAEIEPQLGSSSLVFAFKATLFLQQNLFLKTERDSADLLTEARAMAEKAIELDPWHALNHRYLSFAACYSGDVEDARSHMLIGQSLAPADPLQSIATAEVCAFADDLGAAVSLSDQLAKERNFLPRYAYGYLSIVRFAAEDFENAARFAKQAPTESMDYRAIRIAALWELGFRTQARDEMNGLMHHLAREHQRAQGLDRQRVVEWLVKLNPFSNPRVNYKYSVALQSAAA